MRLIPMLGNGGGTQPEILPAGTAVAADWSFTPSWLTLAIFALLGIICLVIYLSREQ